MAYRSSSTKINQLELAIKYCGVNYHTNLKIAVLIS